MSSPSASVPTVVSAALARAESSGFPLSCEPGVGRLLATLAAAVPRGGRILELGTGVGVGLAWLVHGLWERSDVELVTVELDPATQGVARSGEWPAWVRFELGDGARAARELGRFSLIFADAPGGKLDGLGDSVEALDPGGMLVVDDMNLALHDDPTLRQALTRVRAALLENPDLVVTELEAVSGVMLATRRMADEGGARR